MSIELFYTAPKDKYFKEVKDASIAIWKTYDDTFGYATEKTSFIEKLENVNENFMVIFQMFDPDNQSTLKYLVSEDCWHEIMIRYN